MKPTTIISSWELARHLLDMPGSATNEEIEDELYSTHSMDIGEFEDFIETLLPLITVASGPITGKLYKGLAVGDHWLARIEVGNAQAELKAGTE